MVGLCSLALWCTGNFFFYSAIRCKWSVYDFWPYGVQGIFLFSYSAIRCKWSVYNLWPYGVQGIFIFLIPPYGVNGRFMFFGPMVYRAFLILFRHTMLMVGV